MLNNIETHEDQAFAKTQWQALCAKAGMTEAGSVKASGLSVDEAHDARKTVRRAINKFVAEMTDKEMADPAIGAALNHASKLVAQLSSGIDMLESKGAAKSATNSDLHVMRNEADFAKRYRTNEQFKAHDDDGMNVADFLRGVANLRTSPQVHNALSVGTDSSGLLGTFAPDARHPERNGPGEQPDAGRCWHRHHGGRRQDLHDGGRECDPDRGMAR